jgi:ADP-heptose:LPS heptosyltransferase
LAKPSHAPGPRLLVLELWGLGDLALALPFLRTAAAQAQVTLLAQPHAAPLLARFAPAVELVPLTAPWTAFRGKYRLHRWPWAELRRTRALLRARSFDLGVSARPDPRDHALLTQAGVKRRLGFPRAGSGLLLTDSLPAPAQPHRAAHWETLAEQLGWTIPAPAPAPRTGRRIVIHTGAGQAVREWPRERFAALAGQLRAAGWEVTLLDGHGGDLAQLLDTLDSADRFIGNDSGPGHLAALLGVPTFTIFGPQLPELFAPRHPRSAWVDGAPCPHQPCFDRCRFAAPHCLLDLNPETVWSKIQAWLQDRPA